VKLFAQKVQRLDFTDLVAIGHIAFQEGLGHKYAGEFGIVRVVRDGIVRLQI
jgi:hypothetical protein